jgi:hypothetical protein
MAHYIEEFADWVNELLHSSLGPTLFFKQEIIEVPALLTALHVPTR